MTTLSKNIIYNFLGQVALLLLGFVAVRYMFNRLGGDAVGIIYFVAMMKMVFSAVLEMGICATTVREVSGHYHLDTGYIHRMIRTFSLFYWTIYLLLAVIVYFFSPLIVRYWINIVSMDKDTAVFVLRFLGIAALTVFPRSFFASLFKGLQKMEINNTIDVIVTAFQQIGAITILLIGGGIYSFVVWYSACYVLQLVAYILISMRIFSYKSLIPWYSHDVVVRNKAFAVHMIAISFLATINVQADKLIVSKILPISLLGYYGFAYSAISRTGVIGGAISQAAYPMFSKLFREGNKKALSEQYHKLQDMLCYGMVPVLAFVMFFFMPAFSYMFDIIVARKLLLPAFFLCVGFYMNNTLKTSYVYSLAVGKPRIGFKQNLYTILIVLPLSVGLIKSFGLKGAGFSWVFYQIFAYLYSVPRVCRECLDIPVFEWYAHIAKIFVLIAGTYGVAWYVISVNEFNSFFLIFGAYAVASTFFILISFFMVGKGLKGLLEKYFNNFVKLLVGRYSLVR
ncbi:MAG: oligosaccharide flippase family protein [Candidatus Omnitrophota bacterium]